MHPNHLRERRVMIGWSILDLFKPNPIPKHKMDVVRFIRMEYGKEVQHLHDEDVLAFYNTMLTKRRTQ